MADSQLPNTDIIKLALSCKCPKCRIGNLFESKFSMKIQDTCPSCGLDLSENDCGDGPAVFMIFILGFLLVPAALLLEVIFSPPMWVHSIVWTIVAIGLTFGTLRPLKAYIIALQFKHRPGIWDKHKKK